MIASVGAVLLRSTNADISVMPSTAITTPMRAVSIGSPIASTDPKASSSTTIATTNPINSDGGSGCSMALLTASPLKATFSNAGAASSVPSTIAWIRSSGTSVADWSNRISMNAIRPSAETVTADDGSVGATTFGSRNSGCRSRASCAVGAKSSIVRPSGASRAMRIVVPDCAGNRVASRSAASCDSVPGMDSLSLTVPPAAFDQMPTTASN